MALPLVGAMPVERAIRPRVGHSTTARPFPFPFLALDPGPAMRPAHGTQKAALLHCDDGPSVVMIWTVVMNCEVVVICTVLQDYYHGNSCNGPR